MKSESKYKHLLYVTYQVVWEPANTMHSGCTCRPHAKCDGNFYDSM